MSPTFLSDLMKIEFMAGRLRAAATYAQCAVEISETIDPQTAEIARREAKKHDDLVPKIRLTWALGTPQGAVAYRDGTKVATAPEATTIQVDPGTFRFTVKADGYKVREEEKTVRAGDRASVTLHVGEPVKSAPKTDVGTTEQAPWRDVSLWAGGALVGVGAIAGVVTLVKKGNLDDQCDGKTCPTDAEADYDSSRTWAAVSTVGIVGGAALLTVGLLLPDEKLEGDSSLSFNVAPHGASIYGSWQF